MTWFQWDNADLLIRLHVQPRARKPGITGLHGDSLKIKVRSLPEGGRANREIIALLAETFSVPRTAVTIKSGVSSRRKQVRIKAPVKLPILPGVSNDDASDHLVLNTGDE